MNIKKWSMTTNIEEAISTYIGETIITPTALSNAIRVILGKPQIQEMLVFYYGEPDDNLYHRFGYDKQ